VGGPEPTGAAVGAGAGNAKFRSAFSEGSTPPFSPNHPEADRPADHTGQEQVESTVHEESREIAQQIDLLFQEERTPVWCGVKIDRPTLVHNPNDVALPPILDLFPCMQQFGTGE
jgi:hypothetical protein